jgi:hypothetical protein
MYSGKAVSELIFKRKPSIFLTQYPFRLEFVICSLSEVSADSSEVK